MLWVYIAMWAIGASLVVYAFALGVGARKLGLAAGLLVLGIALVGGSLIAGHVHNSKVHGIRPDAAPEIMTPGGS